MDGLDHMSSMTRLINVVYKKKIPIRLLDNVLLNISVKQKICVTVQLIDRKFTNLSVYFLCNAG